MAGRQQFQKGQYYAAKYKGTGGDLIIGEVQSVRTSGHIVLTNMLTNQTATKKADVLKRRNKRVSKTQAKKIVAAYVKGGKEEARKTAIAAPEFRNGRNEPQQLELVTPPESKLLKEYNALVEKFEADIRKRMAKFHDDISALLRKNKVAV